MKKLLNAVAIAAVLILSAGCLCGKGTCQKTKQPPKYVFYFIGDGMGKSHVELGRNIYGKLNMDTLPVRGSVITSNATRTTTDSAAAGTALACGVKTLNGRLGMDYKGKPVDSVAVVAKKSGRKVAILTTVGVNNATPAAFYAHVFSRGQAKKIMEQYPESHFDILAGYGVDGMSKKIKPEDFLNGKAYLHGNQTAGNTDSIQGKGIRIINKNEDDFFNMKSLQSPVLVYFPFGWEINRGKSTVRPLSIYVKKSAELMQNDAKGFFLMAEGGHIDHGGHGNNGPGMLYELKEFDNAIGKALEFYAQHPDETLIIVTADHHTGGLMLDRKVSPEYLKQMMINFGFTDADTKETALKKMADKGICCTAFESVAIEIAADAKKGKAGALAAAARRIVEHRAGICWATRSHADAEVPLFAIGSSAELFAGRQENSEVALKLKSLYK